MLGALHRKKWEVFSRPPFGGPESVLRYLANYTHRIAISDRRIRRIDSESNTVTFAYRDYADDSRPKEMTLAIDAFIRRFAQHILPPGLHRIRHYGFLANNRRKRDIAAIRELLDVRAPAAESPSAERLCPNCGSGPLRCVAITDSVGRVKIFPGKIPILDSS